MRKRAEIMHNRSVKKARMPKDYHEKAKAARQAEAILKSGCIVDLSTLEDRAADYVAVECSDTCDQFDELPPNEDDEVDWEDDSRIMIGGLPIEKDSVDLFDPASLE
jgi:hypothetical protein